VVLTLVLSHVVFGAVPARALSFVVNSTGDTADQTLVDGICDTGSLNSQGDVECTLRAAIAEANAQQGTDSILFSIPTTEPGYVASPLAYTIQPATALPIITAPVILDGTSQPDFGATPIIVIDGVAAGVVDGIGLQADDSEIRGLVVQNFADDGIQVGDVGIPAANNLIAGNYVGTDVTGMLDRGNDDGILVYGDNNTIGGTSVADRNVTSGNADDGVSIDRGNNNVILGNYVGLNAAGTGTIANSGEGVAVQFGATGNVVGGSVGNVISGNSLNGIQVRSTGTASTSILGNLIGVNPAGDAAMPNGGPGIHVVSAINTVIGGASPSDRNVISGNTGDGIALHSGATGSVILGNRIGTNTGGTAAIPNGGDGIFADAPGAIIGGSGANEGNLVSGNTGNGVRLEQLNQVVRGNLIGTDITGSLPLGNGGDGIDTGSGTGGSVIGGTSPGSSNIIAFNGGHGVSFRWWPNTSGTVLGNSIFSNGGLGINIAPISTDNAPNPNDAFDVDVGPNDLLNFPEITSALSTSGTTIVNFDLDVPTGDYRIEFFANPSSADPSGFGEGQILVSSVNISHAGTGVEPFSHNFPGTDGDVLTATTTRCTAVSCNGFDVTSEFSATVTAAVGNNPPVLNPIGPQTGDELTLITFTATASDPDSNTLTYSLVGAPTGASIGSSNGVFTWTPTQTQGPASYTFDVVVTDNGTPALTDSETITVTVDEAKSAPILIRPGNRVDTAADSVSLAMTATDTDLPPDILTWSAADLPTGLSIDPVSGEISGILASPGLIARVHTVTVTVDDGNGGVSSVIFAWTVLTGNRRPFAGDDFFSVMEGKTLTVDAPGVLSNDTDPDGEPLGTSLVVAPSQGIVALASDGSFVYMHTSGSDADDSFTYEISDGRGGFDIAVVSISVIRANATPVAEDDVLIVTEDTPLLFDPLANDTDPDGDVLTVGGLVQPTAGLITSESTGELLYTPPQDFAGSTTATYTVRDPYGGSDTAVIRITVLPVNDAPVGSPDKIILTSYLPQVIPVLANDTDPDGDVLTVDSVGKVDRGAVAVDSGAITFTPPDEWVGSTTFTYTVVDPDGASDVAEVTVVLADQTLASARALAIALGADAVTFATLVPPVAAAAITLTMVDSVTLLATVFYQTIAAFQLPLVFLGLSLLVLVGLGSATKVPFLLAGKGREHWSVVLLDRETPLRVYDEPDTNSPIIYNFNPTTESILSTGRPRVIGDMEWIPVHTPRGEGWTDTDHLTEQVDLATFTEDKHPTKVINEFAKLLRTGGDVSSLIADRGIILALTGPPTRLAPKQFAALMGGSRLKRLPTLAGVLHDQEDFHLAVAEPFLSAFDATEQITARVAHSRTALIPSEVLNFRYLALGESTSQAWLVFFEYESGKPRIVGLGIDE